MKKLTILTIAFILPFLAFAHEGNKSFFKIEQKETTVEVTAEFPWTIRSALLYFVPELKTLKTKEAFDAAFFEYIKSSFILMDKNGTQLELISIESINLDSHSHQNDFLFSFKGISLDKVSNQISFNLNSNQINHHTIVDRYEMRVYETTLGNPNFEISKQNNATFGYLWLLALLPLGLGFLFKKKIYYLKAG